MALPVPIVRGNVFTYFDTDGNAQVLTVDSPEWKRWAELHQYFRYDDARGGFSAHKYARHGYGYRHRATGKYIKRNKPSGDPDLEFIKKYTWWYWYAFRNIRIGEEIFSFKAYIGAHPSPERMEKASARLTEKINAWAAARGIQVVIGKRHPLIAIVYPT